MYEGEFEYGKRTGFGKQTYWCDEFNAFEVYVGQWLNDKREGSGILYMGMYAKCKCYVPKDKHVQLFHIIVFAIV